MIPGFKRTVVEFLLRGVNLGSVQMCFFDDGEHALTWLGQAQPAGVASQAP